MSKKLKDSLKRFLSVTLAVTTILWMTGGLISFALPSVSKAETLTNGDLIRGPDGIKVYSIWGSWKRHIYDPNVFNMYGHLRWDAIHDVSQAVLDSYQTSDLYRMAGDYKVYKVGDDGVKHWLNMSAADFVACGYSWDQIFTINQKEHDYYTTGSDITSCGTTPAPSAGLTVSLASDNPGAASIIADTTSGDGAQSLIPFLKVKFENGDSSDVKVTQIAFKRTGISADSDISQAYLYDGDTYLADYNSFSSGVLTFSNSSGLFTVPAGGSKTITLKADLANGTGSGKTIRFSVVAAEDISSDASTLNGSFPLDGNYMSTATTDDLGKLTVAVSTAPSSTIDPQTGAEVFNFTMAAADQNIAVYKIKFTNVGSTDYTDLTNFKLYDGGTQVGDTVASMDPDKTVTFDFSSSPFTISKGVTKTMHLKADIVGGTNRTFRFSIQNMTDILAMDTEYGVYIKPNQSDSWTILQASSASTINSGRLTITRASDSASGNVPLDGTGVSLAKFELTATGEDVKITSMVVRVYGTVGTNDLDNGQIIFDGSQKGSTTDLNTALTDSSSADTTFTFGNTFIVPKGTTKTLEIKADIKKGDGTSYSGNETLTAKIQSFVAQGKTSLQTVSSSSATGYQLTIKSGTLSVAKNLARPDWSSSTPTGVPGSTNVMVGSFVVTAGASEGADITAIKVTDKSASSTFTYLQNLKVVRADTGAQIGSTQSSLTSGSTYTFYPSPYISLAKSASVVINVYADIKTSASAGGLGYVKITEVDGTGQTTNTSINWTSGQNGQNIYVGSHAGLTVTTDSSIAASQAVMGTSDYTVGGWTFTETSGAENAIITQVILTDTMTATTSATSTISNLKLYSSDSDDSSPLATKPSLVAAGTATFDLSGLPDGGWVIPAGGSKKLTAKVDISVYGVATPGSRHIFKLASGSVTAKGAISGTAISSVPSSDKASTAQIVFKTKPTVSATALPSTTLAGGTKVLAKFTVAADAGGDLSFKRLLFTVSGTLGGKTIGNDDTTAATTSITGINSGATSTDTAVINAVGLYNSATGEQVAGTAYYENTSSQSYVAYVLTNEEIVSAGTSKTYELRGTILVGGSTGDAISVKIENKATSFSTPKTYANIRGTADSAGSVNKTNSFIWSDRSNTSHSLTTQDWENDYLVSDIKNGTTIWSMSK